MKHAWATDRFYFSSGKNVRITTQPHSNSRKCSPPEAGQLSSHILYTLQDKSHMRTPENVPFWALYSHNLWLYKLQFTLLYFSWCLEWFYYIDGDIKMLEFSVTFLIYCRRFISVQKNKNNLFLGNL